MPTTRSVRIFRLCAFLLFCGDARYARADKLSITSTPAGATVELDGVEVGVTPFEKDFPGGYFRKTHTALGSRLERAMVARISLSGYATKELPLSQGPMNWVGLNGRNHGEYWLLKTNAFHVDLEPISEVFTGSVTASGLSRVSAGPVDELSMEEVIAQTKPAVVYLKGMEKTGTGFFVSDTGVIATNAHVARGEESLLTLLAGGLQLEAKVVYIDPELDIALAKVEGSNFPHLVLAHSSTVRQGESVIAIGNPGDAMLFSVTKGIVSAVGKLDAEGPGTWIQTDAPINPGNSGGPLLNARGEAVGINTRKVVKKNVTGISFALSATDLLEVLHRFYPNVALANRSTTQAASPPVAHESAESSEALKISSSSVPDAVGTVMISSDPDGAEIFVDEKFHGNTPATLRLPAGSHEIVLKFPHHVDWKRTLEVLKSSKLNLKATLEPGL